MAAVHELAQDERRPPFGEIFRAARHGTELTVVRHPHSQRCRASSGKFIFWSVVQRAVGRIFRWVEITAGGTSMRQLAPIAIALLGVTCGGAPPPAAATASPAPSPSAAAAVTSAPTAAPTYAPKAEGFTSKLLVEKPRNLGTSAPGLVWIAKGATTDGVSA